jgi:hypothetical protein
MATNRFLKVLRVGRVGSGKLLVTLDSKFIHESESLGTHDHIILSYDSGSCEMYDSRGTLGL